MNGDPPEANPSLPALRLGILASHQGSTLQAVIDGCADGRIDADIALVISNNSTSLALQRARASGLATEHLSHGTHPLPGELDKAILGALKNAKVDLVLLCGYMKKLGGQTLEHYRGALLNTHPSLLPKYGGQGFYGSKVHEAVLASGDTESGVTLHQVDQVYDSGEIIEQRRVPVESSDTLADLEARVKAAERDLLVSALSRMAAKKRVDQGRT